MQASVCRPAVRPLVATLFCALLASGAGVPPAGGAGFESTVADLRPLNSAADPSVDAPPVEASQNAHPLEALLTLVAAGDWATALPALEAAADTVQGAWIPEIFGGLARAALARDDDDTAWLYLETGRLRYLESLGGFPPEPATRSPIALETVRVLLSGARAALLAYGDSRILPPLCFVVHAEGMHAFELRLDGSAPADRLGALVSTPYTRVPPATERLFIQPPITAWSLPFEDAPLPPRGAEPAATLGERHPISYLPWSSVLAWASPPRTRSGKGLWVLGGGADPPERARLSPASPADLDAAREEADVLHLRGAPPGAPAESGGGSTAAKDFLVLDAAVVSPREIATGTTLADLVILEGGRFQGDPAWLAAAWIASGARSVLVLDRELDEPGRLAFEGALYAQLRNGAPRDVALAVARRDLQEDAPVAEIDGARLWGPGHLPVYALMPRRGWGSLLLSWVLFLGVGFVLFRWVVRRFVQRPE